MAVAAAAHITAVGKVSMRGWRWSVASCRAGAGTGTWSCNQPCYPDSGDGDGMVMETMMEGDEEFISLQSCISD